MGLPSRGAKDGPAMAGRPRPRVLARQMLSIRPSPALADFALTTLTAVITAASTLVVLRILAVGLGAEGFAEYAVARRDIAMVAPLVVVSLDISLRRFLPAAGRDVAAYLAAALCLVSLGTLVLIGLVVVSPAQAAWLAFGDAGQRALLAASLVFVGGYVLHVVTCSFLLGTQKVNRANMTTLVFSSVGSVAAAALTMGDAAPVTILYMAAPLYASLFVLVPALRTVPKPAVGSTRSALRQLVRFGLPRMPAGFLFGGLLALGPVLAAHLGHLGDAGYLAMAQYLLRLLETAIVGFGLVALSRMARLIDAGNEVMVAQQVRAILVFLFQVAAPASVMIYLDARHMVPFWFGPEYAPAIPLMELAAVTLMPFLGYVMTYNIVDLLDRRPLNSFHLLVSLIVGAAASWSLYHSGFGTMGIAWGSALGFLVLGALTARCLLNRCAPIWSDFGVAIVTTWSALTLVIGVAVNSALARSGLSAGQRLAVCLLWQGAAWLVYIVILNHRGSVWILELRKRVRRSRGQ